MKKKIRIQSHASLREEMKAVARGEKAAPKNANKASYNSVNAVLAVLTPENRELLAAIRDRKPKSITELAALMGRAQPNVSRTLGKLESCGFVRINKVDHRKVPTVVIHSLQIKVDPFSENDQLEVA